MRQTFSIVKATALEILSEPLTLLLVLSALVLTVLAPAFHYHQFGDPTRMARDAGFSALFMCASAIAVFGTIRSFRREIETGTLEMALAHPVSRTAFFLSKTAGALAATGVVSLIVLCTTDVIFEGARIGGLLAQRTGDIARLFGPCLAAGVAVIVLPLVVAAALNRFARFRFVLSSVLLAGGLSLASVATLVCLTGGFDARLLLVAALTLLPPCVFLAAAAAAAVRFKANAAAAAVGTLVALSVPAIGNYYLVDALGARADGLSWGYVVLAAAAVVPATAAFLLLGVHFINGRDIQWTT